MKKTIINVFGALAIALIALVASTAYANIYTRTGRVTNVMMCMDSGTAPYCLFLHDGEPDFWFAVPLLNADGTNNIVGQTTCSLAMAAQLSGKTVTTRHTSYMTICGHQYTRKLYTGDNGVGLEMKN
jgi:hypothetical protein